MTLGVSIEDMQGTDWNFLHTQTGKEVVVRAEGEEGESGCEDSFGFLP